MKKHMAGISYFLLIAVITANSLLYILADFKTYDVIPAVRSYGIMQLALTLILLFMLLFRLPTRNKRTAQAAIFNGVFWLLILMQLIPALFWILFDGRTVAEYPWDYGITGNWLYGAYHIAISVWGIVVFSWYKRRHPDIYGCADV